MLRFAFILLLALLPLRAIAQTAEVPEAALLVADQLYITPERVLVASGNVEAFQNGVRLRADTIKYDQSTGALSIEGPITLTEADGTIIVASAAELDAGLRNGILKGARLVLDQQLQLAAAQIDRVDGRFNQLYNTVVTSCRVCEDGGTPLWQIRAKRVIHDEVAQQLYFDSAQFRIGNIPVFWLPRLRLPGPKLKRATGFLIPSIQSNSTLGTGLKIPYFIKVGEHRDLTLTPYLTSRTKTLEFRYRQAFRTGEVEFNGAVSRDDILPEETRGYLFGNGRFALPRNYTLTFQLQTVTDDGYLGTYGFSGVDRLRSELKVVRATRDEFVRASFINFESLRDDEPNSTLPTRVLDGEYERRFFPEAIGGEVRARIIAHSHIRTSDLPFDGPDVDDIVDGRDVARINAGLDWLRSYTWDTGLRSDTRLGFALNTFNISQDVTAPTDPTELTPHAQLSLRYPLSKTNSNGVSHLLEPVVQVSWTGGSRLAIPNDESTLVEFDQGNLLSLSRFPRADRRERGTTAAIGLGWSRFDPQGWDAHVSLGQVFRQDEDVDFSATSGLDGLTSDLLVAGQINALGGMSITGRSLFEGDLSLSKAEFRGDYAFARGRLGGSYVWLEQDSFEDRPEDVSEFALNGSYAINDFWTGSANWRYDVASERAATVGAALRYVNECVTVDLTLLRRLTSSSSVEASTDFGFNIGLRGFAANSGTERLERSCSN